MMIDTCYLDNFYQQQKNEKQKPSLPAPPYSQLLPFHTNHSKADTHLKIDQRMQMEIKIFTKASEYDSCLMTVLRKKGNLKEETELKWNQKKRKKKFNIFQISKSIFRFKCPIHI